MVLTVFGFNHTCIDLEKLEKLTFSPDDVLTSLALLYREPGIQECVILSTCNRIELYTVCQEGLNVRQTLHDFMKHAKPAGMEEIGEKYYFKEGHAAMQHLFAVSSSLDSIVVGENEIAGQMKRAYRRACDLKTTGAIMNKLFHAAFKTSKRVKNETMINEGNCSVGCAAVDIAEELFPKLDQCQVLLIGAGDMGKVVARTFANRQIGKLIIANRSVARAVELADEVGGTAIPLDKIDEYLGQVDVIVSGTGSPEYLLRYEDMQKIPQQHLLMVDIALPRDFDPKIETLPNVVLKNLYDLKDIVNCNIRKREGEIPQVKAIIADELEKFLKWKDSLKINSTIKVLNTNFEALRRQELERYQHQFSEEACSQLDVFTKSLTKKYLHLIISNIKSLYDVCDLDAGQIHILEHLFDSQGVNHEETCCRYKRQQSC